MRSSTLLRAYRRSRLLRNAMAAAFVCLSAATLLWAIPWVPPGMTPDDYSFRTGGTVGLALMAGLAALATVHFRDRSNRYEQTLVTWSSVHDGLGDLRRREYLYERAVVECVRAERSGIPFGVFAVRFSVNEDANGAETATALEALAGLIRQSDTLAALGPQEVGVLGAGMSPRDAPAFAYRLKSAIEKATDVTDTDQVSVGWSIWGTDGSDAGTLVGLARSRMQKKTALRDWAKELEGEPPGDEDEPLIEAPAGDEALPEAKARLHVVESGEERADGPAA